MPTPSEIEADDAAVLVEHGAQVLDVREPDEWAVGHIVGSLHLPMGELAARVGEVARDRRVVVVCRSGSRSMAVAEALAAAGYDVVNLAGGLQAWAADDLPLEADDGLPGAVA